MSEENLGVIGNLLRNRNREKNAIKALPDILPLLQYMKSDHIRWKKVNDFEYTTKRLTLTPTDLFVEGTSVKQYLVGDKGKYSMLIHCAVNTSGYGSIVDNYSQYMFDRSFQ